MDQNDHLTLCISPSHVCIVNEPQNKLHSWKHYNNITCIQPLLFVLLCSIRFMMQPTSNNSDEGLSCEKLWCSLIYISFQLHQNIIIWSLPTDKIKIYMNQKIKITKFWNKKVRQLQGNLGMKNLRQTLLVGQGSWAGGPCSCHLGQSEVQVSSRPYIYNLTY